MVKKSKDGEVCTDLGGRNKEQKGWHFKHKEFLWIGERRRHRRGLL